MSAYTAPVGRALTLPCTTNPELFSPPEWERDAHRAHRQAAAVALCRTGGPDGEHCPALNWCAKNIDPKDAWTVQAGRTPEDRGHKRKKNPNRPPSTKPQPDCEDATWPDCGTGWGAVVRHTRKKVPTCKACKAFRRNTRADKASNREVAA